VSLKRLYRSESMFTHTHSGAGEDRPVNIARAASETTRAYFRN